MNILILLLVSITLAVDVKIGALFDNDVSNSQQIFKCAIQIANDLTLADSDITLVPRNYGIIFGSEFAASRDLCKLLKRGVSAVFGPSSPTSSAHCINICDAKEVPYIDVHYDSESKLPVINIHPNPDAVAQVVADIIKAKDWTQFSIVYESTSRLKRAEAILKFFESKEYNINVRRISVGLDKTNYRPALRRIKSEDSNIVLDCSIEALPEVLKQAQQVGLMTDYHQFIITTMDFYTVDLEPYRYSGTNITGIRVVDPQNPLMEHLADCIKEISFTPETMSLQSALIFDGVLLLAEVLKEFDVDHLTQNELDCNDNEAWENGNSISNFMRNTIVQGLTGEVKFDNQGYRTSFDVDVFELTESGISTIGIWKSINGLNITRKHEEIVVDEDLLKNKKLIVITALTPPYGMLTESTTNLSGNDRFEGFGIDLIHELSQMLGFKYEFTLQEDGAYGSIDNKTGEWNGMIREVIDGRADLAITDLTITAERESGVDFTHPFMNLGISILFKKPTQEPPSTFSFMSPFSTQVWGYLGGAYLGVSLCLYILGRISPSEWDNPYPCIEDPIELKNQFSLTNALWFSTGALLQQGSEIAPKAPSTRVASTIWWFFTLIMVSSYTANLAAFLTIETLSPIIESAEDLKNCSDPGFECPVTFGAKKDGSTINFFKTAEHETFKKMYTYMENNPEMMTKNNKEGLERAEKENYAFLMESSSIEYLIERNCSVTQIGGLLDEKGYGIAMRKNSSYRNALSEAILSLQERGKLTALKIKWWKEKKGGGSCSTTSGGGDADALKMENMYGVFYVLSVGSAFATLYGIIEWLVVVFVRARRQNVPFKYELMQELKFIWNCGGNTKTIRHRRRTPMNSNESNKSFTTTDSNKHSDEITQ